MKTRTLLLATSTLGLVACINNVLWTSAIEDANVTGALLPIATQGNAVYQLYPVSTQLYLRKLDSAGKLQWQIPVDETLANSITSPKLQSTETGVVVGYHDNAAKAAFVRTFDAEGNTVWTHDLGEHASETLDDMVVDRYGNVTIALRLSFNATNVLRVDNSGIMQWETSLPNCNIISGCVASLALDDQDGVLVANAEGLNTRSYLFDANGTQLWARNRATGLSTLGLVSTKVTPSATGFVLTHPFVSWHYDRNGTETWSNSGGSPAAAAIDSDGNIYVPGNGKIVQLDSTGTPLRELALNNQVLRQLVWDDNAQRVIALTSYETVGPEIDATVTAKTGMNLWVFDADGVRKARYQGKPTETKSSLCSPYPQCTGLSLTHGENWNQFAITGDKKLVVSGQIQDSERFAKAYRMY